MSEADEVQRVTREHTYGTWRKQKGWMPLNVVDARGSYFFDSSGKGYLDLSSQLMCSNLGHKNEAVMKAIAEQAMKLPYVSPSFTCEVRAKATEALLQVFPEGLPSSSIPHLVRRRMKQPSRLQECTRAG